MRYLHLDIETGDPDDLWTLALMATHPKVMLKTVSVFPGRPDQIGLVRKVLNLVNRKDVIIGADIINDNKKSVGDYYYNWLGEIPNEDPDVSLYDLKFKHIKWGCELLTGGPLKNIEVLLKTNKLSDYDELPLFTNWTAQGGFVGCNIIPDLDALEKFRNKETMATYNLGGHKNSALYLTGDGSKKFKTINMVGKNVCHGFIFTQDDVKMLPRGKHDGLDIMINGMEGYCKKNPAGKAMHDILAALLHINPMYGKWVSGNPYRQNGEWGFRLNQDSNIKALISIDKIGVMSEI